MTKQHLNPPELFNSRQYGFSQVVSAQGGKTIYLSGQVGWDARQQMTGLGDLAAQTRQALRNIVIGLRAAGASLEDIVSMRIYILTSELVNSAAISAALLEFFPENPPATTWIGVQALANPDFLVEIEPVAVIEAVFEAVFEAVIEAVIEPG
jgi:enamine deaminase RidA (YjgF/YER057c/UK114 family)